MRKAVSIVLLIGLVMSGWARPAVAQERRLSFIRDAEIEHIIRTYAQPIFQAAGLNPRAVDIYLVADASLNAFVSGGQNLYINTGLLMQAENAAQVIGVIAHETGHLAGGHLARGQEAMDAARRRAFLTSLLGIAAAVASREGGAAAAALAGGQTIGQRSFLNFTRSMESAADQAALNYLDRTGYSAEGLLSFLQGMADQELVPVTQQVEYVRTHPLTYDRIQLVETHVARSPLTGQPLPAGYDEMFRRMQAKLVAFITPQQVARRYPDSDTSVAARYARSIANFRRGDIGLALDIIDRLIAEEPSNPYFHEFRGQILLETGRLAEARPSYERAVQLQPDSPLLLIALAQTKIESDSAGAIADLTRAIRAEGRGSAFAWHLLATAYGRAGDVGMAAVALAEEGLAQGDEDVAWQQADRAQQLLPRGSPGWLRAEDIKRLSEDL